MDYNKQQELTKLTRSRLDIARKHLNASTITESVRMMSSLEAEIPGFEKKPMKFGQFVNKEFVLLMTDIRKSTNLINKPGGEGNMFQIFYAYSALIANIVDSYGGTATEFLGDGVLCLFEIDGTIGNTLEASMRAAKDIMSARREIINPAFMQFDLPLIDYGIGIDYGKTIVTRFGFKEDNDLKAFGKCAYAVSRLCKGVNEIKVSEKSKSVWPSSANGGLTLMYDSDADGKLAYRASY